MPDPRWKKDKLARIKRKGKTSKAEKAIVAKMVMDHPGPIDERQIRGMGIALRRTKQAIRNMVEEARDNFVSSAGDYVQIHMKATKKALAKNDAKSLDVAAKSSQWAIEHMSADGVRVVEKSDAGPTGAKILIGINVGGVDASAEVIDVPVAPTVKTYGF